MTPLISVVTGTYRRLDFLRSMVQSVRDQLPDGIDYELVVVDGGSDDGTPEWCAQQTDIRFIQQGELRGAIAAFTEGARAAQGKYVVLANDDVQIQTDSLLKAVVHLETHPDCGAVAFAEDREAPGYTTDLHVQTITAIREGRQVSVPYAQVGMFRKWLGELANWWDMGHPKQHTYGGDNHLSAWIWEHGYTVDAVEGCAIHDQVAPDGLRERNTAIELGNGSAFYATYADGVHIASKPKPAQQDSPRLRILMATLYEPGFGKYKHGLRDAFKRVGLVADIDYLSEQKKLLDVADAWKPQLVFTQMANAELMRWLRALCPGAIIVNWHGDVWMQELTSAEMTEQARYLTMQLVVNAEAIPYYEKLGVMAAYWQVAPELVEPKPNERSHDILFMANAYSQERRQLGNFLLSLRGNGYDVGLYGQGWKAANGVTLYDFARGAALYRRCKLAIGDNQYGDQGFVSNRLFEALGNGACLLHQHVPGLEALTGLKAGVHYYEWRTLRDLEQLIHRLMKDDGARQAVAEKGEQFVRTHHTFDHRVAELFALLERMSE